MITQSNIICAIVAIFILLVLNFNSILSFIVGIMPLVIIIMIATFLISGIVVMTKK
jgi:hypothetical protein